MAINPINKDIEEVLEVSKDDMGISTGIERLDDVIHGLCPSKLYTIAGFSGVGKTSLLTDLLLKSAEVVPTAFFSLDMGAVDIKTRLLYNIAGLNHHTGEHNIRHGGLSPSYKESLVAAADKVRELNPISLDLQSYALHKPYFLREPDESTKESSIELSIKEHHKEGYRIFFIDHVQKITWGGKDAGVGENLRVITDRLHSLSVKYNVPIIILAQMTKELAAITSSRKDPTPIMSDIYGSVMIQANSDVVLLLHRPEIFKQHKASAEEMLYNDLVEDDAQIIVGKMRSGPGPRIDVDFHAFSMSWKSKTEERF